MTHKSDVMSPCALWKLGNPWKINYLAFCCQALSDSGILFVEQYNTQSDRSVALLSSSLPGRKPNIWAGGLENGSSEVNFSA